MAGQSTTKYDEVSAAIRDGVIDGQYAPGQRIPTQVELAKMFGVSLFTIQRALGSLANDGFVHASTKNGTFVAQHLPHLCNYGLVTPGSWRWSRLFMAIRKAAEMLSNESLRFREYVTSQEAGNREDIRRLYRDIRGRRVGGLIFNGVMTDIVDTPILEQKVVPCVREQPRPKCDIPTVYLDIRGSFVNRAVEYLTARGCRRIAHLVVMVEEDTPLVDIAAWLKKTGIEVKPHWVHSIYPRINDKTTANIVNVLMHLQGDDRPDALLIHDDNLTEHAMAGLMTAGVKVPKDLEVVTHCNYPAPAPTSLPMKRLGFDCRLFLRKCIEVIEMERKGQTPPSLTLIPAIFEEELDISESALPGEDR